MEDEEESFEDRVEKAARVANASYEMARRKRKRTKRLEDSERLAQMEIMPSHTDVYQSTFQESPDTFHIGVRGTKLDGNRWAADVAQDLGILTNLESHSKLFKARERKLERTIRKLREQYGDDITIHASGHSLGGKALHDAMVNNEYIRNNIHEAHFFNPGTSPGIDYEKSRRKLRDHGNSHLHHVEGDIISQFHRKMGGKRHRYRQPRGNKTIRVLNSVLKKVSPIYSSIDKARQVLRSHSLANFL